MARRLFNGNAFSEDGWPYVDEAGCTWIEVPGTNVHLAIQTGPPVAIMGAVAADFNAYVEPLRDPDSACWTPGNSVATSNHPGATAMDLNWDTHKFEAVNTFNPAQRAVISEIVDFYEGMIGWAGPGYWQGGPVDEMHWQMGYGTYDRDNDRPEPTVLNFIGRKIRSDGFSTFRRGGAPGPVAAPADAVNVLTRATGLTVDEAQQLLPTFTSGLAASQCANVNRIAMWLAQCGEESAGFSTTEEFASGAEYEGRCSDLGNCSPGDGVKYKGRTWIQITGKAHYQVFSQWAFGKGLIGSPTQFVDNPASLGDLPWAGIGAAWYWTVERPAINSMCDARDIVGVTRAINGGTHGLDDRTNRYNRALSLGDQLLILTNAAPTTPGDDMASVPQDQWDRVYRELTQRLPSRSPLRHLDQTQYYPGGLVDTVAGFTLNVDGMTHVQYVQALASYGHPGTLALLREVAGAKGDARYPDRQDDADLAMAILADVTTAPVTTVVNNAVAAPAQPQIVYVDRPVAAPEPAAAVSALPAVVDGPITLGNVVKTVVDAVEQLKLADALTIQDRATLAASIKILEMKNGSQI